MAIRVERGTRIDTDPVERWGDAALQQLEAWLVSHGLAEDEAAFVVESVWVWYSYDVLPTTRERGEQLLGLGIVGQIEDGDPQLALSVYWATFPWDDTFVPLVRDLERCIRERLGRLLRVKVQPFIAIGGSPSMFAESTHDNLGRDPEVYVGMFRDDLSDELSLVVGPEYLVTWLTTPNNQLMGREPRELLGTADDVMLRDLLLRAWHGLYV